MIPIGCHCDLAALSYKKTTGRPHEANGTDQVYGATAAGYADAKEAETRRIAGESTLPGLSSRLRLLRVFA